MQLKKARFAALCGVSRPSIGESVKRGSLVATDGLIDLSDMANLAYLAKHNASAATEYQTTGTISSLSTGKETEKKPETDRRPSTHKDMGKKMDKIRSEDATESPDTFDPFGGLSRHGPVGRRNERDAGADDNPAAGLTDSEVAETLRKPLYDAQKAKNDAALKALELDKRNGTLIELEVVMEYMVKLSSAIQKGFLDVIPKQALMICSRLGTVGHEAEVEDLLAEDNTRRIEMVKHIVEEMAKEKWGIKNRHVIKDAVPEEDE